MSSCEACGSLTQGLKICSSKGCWLWQGGFDLYTDVRMSASRLKGVDDPCPGPGVRAARC